LIVSQKKKREQIKKINCKKRGPKTTTMREPTQPEGKSRSNALLRSNLPSDHYVAYISNFSCDDFVGTFVVYFVSSILLTLSYQSSPSFPI
jgi:hypothetical protein